MWYPLVYILALFVCVRAARDCIIAGEDETTWYRQEELARDVLYITEMEVNWKTNKLYFNYYNLTQNRRVFAMLDLDTRTSKDIEELSSLCMFAVNQHSGDVYTGCTNNPPTNGLYQWDSNVGRFVLLRSQRESVSFVHYADDMLYYRSSDGWLVRTYAHGGTQEVPQLVNHSHSMSELVVDGNGDWIYSNLSGLYRVSRATGAVTEYTKSGDMRSLAKSPGGEVYACAYLENVIYRVDADGILRRVAIGADCFALTIDTPLQFIYSEFSNGKLIRLIEC